MSRRGSHPIGHDADHSGAAGMESTYLLRYHQSGPGYPERINSLPDVSTLTRFRGGLPVSSAVGA